MDLKAIATERATAHGLRPSLVMAVIEQESSWNPWAIRYEPGFFDRYLAGVSSLTPTEQRARSFSYGLMQVMGQTAREIGFSERYLAQLCDPFTGIHFGCLKLVRCYAQASGEDEGALLHYNGGGNPQYPAQVLARESKYQ